MIVIMNPPYGKSSSLSKKILNKIHESGIADEIVCLAPPSTFFSTADYVRNYTFLGTVPDYFEVPAQNDSTEISIAIYDKKKYNKFTELDMRFHDEKLRQLRDACYNYNSNHPTFIDKSYKWGGMNKKNCEYLKSEIAKGLDPNDIFTIAYYSPRVGVQYGECGAHNYGDKLWDFDKQFSSALFIVLKKGYKKNFFDFWYKGELIKKLLLGIKSEWSVSPGPVAYEEMLPHLDWSHSWTDEEIIKELKSKAGLPKDWKISKISN